LGGPILPLLADGFRALGDDVTIYTLDETVAMPTRFDGPGLRIWVGPYRSRHRMRDFMRAERHAIRDMIRADPVDAVSAWWSYEFALGAMASGIPTMVSVCDWAPAVLRHSPDLYRLGRLAMAFACFARARDLTAVSPPIARRLRRCGLTAPVLGQPVPDLAALRVAAKAPDAPFVFVGAGFGRLKNLAALLRAMPRVRARLPGARLSVFGDEHAPGGVSETWARAQGLADGVDFLGPRPQDEVLRTVARARALVHPSREESFGQAVAEAMALGTPVIGHIHAGGVPWLLEDGACGALVDATDPDALAEAMIALVADRVRANELARRAAARIEGHFTPQAVACAYRDALRRLLDNRAAATS
jgi:glycosyltransferase involved in cell wall biosynthesis